MSYNCYRIVWPGWMERPNNWKSFMLNDWPTETLPLQINVSFHVISVFSCSVSAKVLTRVRITVTKCWLLEDWMLQLAFTRPCSTWYLHPSCLIEWSDECIASNCTLANEAYTKQFNSSTFIVYLESNYKFGDIKRYIISCSYICK